MEDLYCDTTMALGLTYHDSENNRTYKRKDLIAPTRPPSGEKKGLKLLDIIKEQCASAYNSRQLVGGIGNNIFET